MSSSMYRFDLVFSYWVVAWWLLYLFRLIDISPKLAILIGIVENVGLWILLWFMNAPSSKLWIFGSVVFFIKWIPLWTVWDVPLQWKKELFYTACLFLVYVAWLAVNGLSNLHQTALLIRESRKKGRVSKKVAPMMALIQNVLGR